MKEFMWDVQNTGLIHKIYDERQRKAMYVLYQNVFEMDDCQKKRKKNTP